jgi:protein dithiol oxidoreductase (disulfide-forming)
VNADAPMIATYNPTGGTSMKNVPRMRITASVLATVLVLGAAALPAQAAMDHWVEGTHYVVLVPAQPTTVPAGKVEVMEVFSYACPFCNKFQPIIRELEHSLPPDAQMVFLPAAFNAAEDWPMFQRAYFAAQALGIAARTHQALYDAVWKTGELATIDPETHRLRRPAPTLEDAAHCYARLTGVSPQKFLAAARSFGVAMKMREADQQVMAMQIPGTPCIVVDGKYRIVMDSLSSPEEVIPLVKYLVEKASERPARAGRTLPRLRHPAAPPSAGSPTSAS